MLWRQTVTSQDEILQQWCQELLAAFELEDVDLDPAAILSLAGVAAHSVIRPAAPLTTFIAGFAAGLAAGTGQATDSVAMGAALRVAREAVERRRPAESEPGRVHSGVTGNETLGADKAE